MEDSMQSCLNGCEDLATIVSVKKNFKNMLSRDMDRFASNYVKQPWGKNVAYCNETEYLILNFSSLVHDLFCVRESIYSEVGANHAFNELLRKQKKIQFPFLNSFNWKYYAKLFSETCIESYDSDHIILIRCNPAQYYCHSNEIHTNDKITHEVAMQIRAIEDDFIERTHCHCVDELLCHAPIDERFFAFDSYVYEKVADAISKIIFDDKNQKEDFYRYSQPLIRCIYKRLKSEKVEVLADELEEYDDKIHVEIERHFFEVKGNISLFADLHRLKMFLQEERYDLLDYVKEQDGKCVDFGLIELYTNYFKLDISDIIAIFQLYKSIDNKELFRNTIWNICHNDDCMPLSHMKEVILNNQKFLRNYEHIDEELRSELDFDVRKGMLSYPVRISSHNYLILNPHGKDNLIFSVIWGDKYPDIDTLINSDMMICRADEIDLLSKDWTFYIKRARIKKGNVPLYLLFEDKFEFHQSFAFLDYPDILKNENVIISLEKNKHRIPIDTYKCLCNLEPIMDDNLKIFQIIHGLTDQIWMYVFSKYIEKQSRCSVVYDDLPMTICPDFNGLEVRKFVKEGEESFNKKRLSRMISQRLIWEYDINKNLGDFLFEKGWYDISAVIEYNRADMVKMCSKLVIYGWNVKLATLHGFKYYCTILLPGRYLGKNFQADDYVKFPDSVDEKNKKLEQVMLSCDAVVIHFRWGDYAAIGNIPSMEFFKKCLTNLKKIKEYSNLKYFVFSDDMPCTKSHQKEIFGDLSNEDDIFYISHNKGEQSYLDMKLMSLGKIMIASNSGFSFMAAVISKRKEIYITQNKWRNEMMSLLGFRNKYDLL